MLAIIPGEEILTVASSLSKRPALELGLVLQTRNPSAWEAEAGELQVQYQPRPNFVLQR